ncbi:MAG: ATPase [Planctomycetes bacterium RBG_16_55_9]|nr:MAG: ATPase [Planctomycetes bacterium RBG_16_55_9]
MDASVKKLKAHITQSVVLLLAVMAIIGTLFCTSSFAEASAKDQTAVEPETTNTRSDVIKFGLFAAAIAFGLGAIGAGFAISHVGAAAMGAIAEKPEIGSQALLFIALAEGLVVFGFITSILILNKV